MRNASSLPTASRLQRRVFLSDDEVHRTGVRVITPDRPGCGRSDFQPGRRIEAWPSDVAALVDHLQLGRFAVLGFSGGTPYAIALAASRLPVTALGIVSGDAPPGAVPGASPALPCAADTRPRTTAAILRLIRWLARRGGRRRAAGHRALPGWRAAGIGGADVSAGRPRLDLRPPRGGGAQRPSIVGEAKRFFSSPSMMRRMRMMPGEKHAQ